MLMIFNPQFYRFLYGKWRCVLQAGDGIDPQLIVEAWEAAFDSSSPAKGGCPDAPSYL